jgi:hypothetical protein
VLTDGDDEPAPVVVPVVDDEEPRVRIYDTADDGSYWYHPIGFRARITDT